MDPLNSTKPEDHQVVSPAGVLLHLSILSIIWFHTFLIAKQSFSCHFFFFFFFLLELALGLFMGLYGLGF